MDSYEPKANTNRKRVKRRWDLADPNIDRMRSNSYYDPYDLLCLAIIRQAVKDTWDEKSDAYKFWTSDWYDVITTNLPQFENIGEKIRDQAIQNHKSGNRAGIFGDLY